MPTEPLHLPNGYVFSVTPVFGGMAFKHNEINYSHSILPPGWSVIIGTERAAPAEEPCRPSSRDSGLFRSSASSPRSRTAPGSRNRSPSGDENRISRTPPGRFRNPTLDRDSLFISSLFLPPSSEFKPPISPTRQIAMMLWATLWWYFQLPEPNQHVNTPESALTPESGRPKADWHVYIKREGVLKGRHLMAKLERMGLVTCEDSSVGLDPADPDHQDPWGDVYVSRRTFWQLDPRIFLYTLKPATSMPATVDWPYLSRPGSPSRDPGGITSPTSATGVMSPEHLGINASLPGGPFYSSSHLPTYFPPHPALYTFSNGIRHPIRPKPPRQGETFYVRYVRSVGQSLSFRVPILHAKESIMINELKMDHRKSVSISSLPATASSTEHSTPKFDTESDLDVLHRWMNNPRVNAAWGAAGPHATQERFLRKQLTSSYSFPAFGCWDGKPFGFFQIYWIKESNISRLLHTPVGNWDRGFHCLIGEDDYRSSHRVQIWLSSLVHFCWLSDNRTENVILEPRVDNEK